MRKFLSFVIAVVAAVAPVAGRAQVSISGPGGMSFLEIDIHGMVGGSYVTENYMDCFSEISDLNSNMGLAVGIGVGAKFNVTRSFGLGTGLNYVRNRGTLDMAVTGQGAASISNVFQRNSYYTFDFPIYFSFSPYIAKGVRWNFDIGMYYSYGVRGHQRNTIYDAKTNDLGQLMTSRTVIKTDYYKDGAFINSFRRGDIGLHIAAGMTFFGHLNLGVRSHIGFKNVAETTGIKRPNSHNISFMAMAGWIL